MPARGSRLALGLFLLALPCACTSAGDYAEALWGPADHHLLGPTDWLAEFELVGSAEDGGTVGMTWLPRGQKVSDWKEELQVLRAPHSGPDAIHPEDPAWRERVQQKSPSDFSAYAQRGHGQDWLAYSFSITRPPR